MTRQFRTPGALLMGAWCLLGVLIAGVTIQAQAPSRQPRILVRDSEVLVSFELADGFTDEVRAAILSGLKTTFTYTVDLRLDVPAWVDRTIATSVVTNSVEYDNLLRRYSVERVIDGRVVVEQDTEDESIVRQMMTALRQLPLFRTSLLEPNREYYVRVTAVARPNNGSFLWPWGSGTTGQAKFTFVR